MYEAEHRAATRALHCLRHEPLIWRYKAPELLLLSCADYGTNSAWLKKTAALFFNFPLEHFRDWFDDSACSQLCWRALVQMEQELTAFAYK